METFFEFVDAKERKVRKHLELVKRILEQGGFKVTDKIKEREDPYLFVYNPDNNLSFEGVRIYQVGSSISYRIQKEASTHPYGKAYEIPIEEMFEDLITDHDDEQKVGKAIIQNVVMELQEFFEKSVEAEKQGPANSDPMGQVMMRTTGTDYADKVTGSDN